MSRELNLSDRDLFIRRLAQQTSLRIPGSLFRNNQPITQDKRSTYLHNLLTHDPGVFLERHGDDLLANELEYFSPLRRTSYEVDFYMKLLEDKDRSNVREKPATGAPPSSCPAENKNAAAKNRRLAKLELLEKEGYFTTEAMRSREPYLYHLYIGQYISHPGVGSEVNTAFSAAEDDEKSKKAPASSEEIEAPTARSAVAQLAGTIMDQHDELEFMLRREAEREAYALQEEEDESEEEDEEKKKKGTNKGAVASAQGVERHSARHEANIHRDWPTPEELTHEQR
jgi:hypothetical protein